MIRKRLKLLFTTITVITAISLLSACGTDDTTATTATTTAPANSITNNSADITADPGIDPQLGISGLDVTVTGLGLGKVEKSPDEVRVDVYYEGTETYDTSARESLLKINDVEYTIQGVGGGSADKFFIWVLEEDLRSNGINNVSDIKKIETRVNPINADGERDEEIIDVTVTAKWGPEDADVAGNEDETENTDTTEVAASVTTSAEDTETDEAQPEASTEFDFSEVSVTIGSESFVFPVEIEEFTKGDLSLDEDVYDTGRIFRMGYKGTTYPDLLIDCYDNMAASIKCGWLPIDVALREAVMFGDGDTSSIPEITVCGIKLGHTLSEDQVEELENLSEEIYEETYYLDDGTVYDETIHILVEKDNGISDVTIYLTDENQVVGFDAGGYIFE